MRDLPPEVKLFARRVLAAIQNIEKAIQGEREAATKAAEAKDTQQSVPPLTRAEVNLPQGVEIHKSPTDTTDDKKYQFRTLLVAWLTLGAVVIYASISGWQLYQMRKATRIAAQQTKISRESLEVVQRPFIVFRGYDIQKISGTPIRGTIGGWRSIITWENAGNTPAIHVLPHFAMFRLKAEPDDKTFKGFFADEQHNPTYIGPKDTQQSGAIFEPLTFFPVLGFSGPGADLAPFMWGWVVYRDSFPNTKIHLTEFCLRLQGIGMTADQSHFIFGFVRCQSHNCADEDCKDYEDLSKTAS